DGDDLARYHTAMDGTRGYLLHEALQQVWRTVARGNEYVDRRAPWKQAKDPEQRGALAETLGTLVRQLARHAVYLAPFMPEKSAEIWTAIGAPGDVHATGFSTLAELEPTGWRVSKGTPLFPKER